MFSSSYGTFSIVSLLCLPLFLGCVCCVCVCLVCDRKKPTDTLDTVRYGTRNGIVTGNGIRTGNGTRNVTGNGARTENGTRAITRNGNRTIRNFEESNFPVLSIQPTTPRVTLPSDSNWRHGTRNGNVTGNGARTGNGIRTITGNGNRTIRRVHFDEFNLPVPSPQPIIPRVTISSDSNRRSVFERTNLSTHFLNETQHNLIRSYNAIPTISRPAVDNFSLQRQTPLHRPRWEFESRVADGNRFPISLSVPFYEPSNSAGANTPSAAPPLERPLSLPSYDQVINQQNYEIEEEPPPIYDKIVKYLGTYI